MKGILKLLLIFFVVFYLLRYIYKIFSLFAPNKPNTGPQQTTFDGHQHYSNASRPKPNKSDEGEYVDFEEVK